MQNPERISLNAVRVFAVAADCGSFKLAAAHLGVTPGAVSRQISNLEAAMGVHLFSRSNNAIALTETGRSFLRNALPGLVALERSIETATRAARSLSVQVSTTLATRWLIPRLDGFRKRRPDIAVSIETSAGTGPDQNPRADVTLAYVPVSQTGHTAQVLLEDWCRPYLSPALLCKIRDTADLSRIPALQCAKGNWDWHVWLKETGAPRTRLRFGGHFDLDDVALRAAIAGMGMVLSSEFMIRDDLEAGRLCALPGAPVVLLGHYTMHISRPAGEAATAFARWLKTVV